MAKTPALHPLVDPALKRERTHLSNGAWAEAIATAWLLEKGFHVFKNVAGTGPVDLVAYSMESATSSM